MTRAELKEMVKARIDELSPLSVTELNSAIDMIDKLLNEGTRKILLTFPRHTLPNREFVTPSDYQTVGQDSNSTTKLDVGYLIINDSSAPDWLRFHSFKMWEWERPVFDLITPEHPLYKLQSNPILMGKPSKPVVALVHTFDGQLALEYYSCDPELQTHNHEIQRAMYIPNTLPEDCDDSLSEAISWSTASLVLQSIKDENYKMAELRLEQIKQLL